MNPARVRPSWHPKSSSFPVSQLPSIGYSAFRIRDRTLVPSYAFRIPVYSASLSPCRGQWSVVSGPWSVVRSRVGCDHFRTFVRSYARAFGVHSALVSSPWSRGPLSCGPWSKVRIPRLNRTFVPLWRSSVASLSILHHFSPFQAHGFSPFRHLTGSRRTI